MGIYDTAKACALERRFETEVQITEYIIGFVEGARRSLPVILERHGIEAAIEMGFSREEIAYYTRKRDNDVEYDCNEDKDHEMRTRR